MRNERKWKIWQNYNINTEDYEDWLNEKFPDRDEYEKFNLCEDLNYEYLEDERMNLNIPLNSKVICIADIGLWNGRRHGYKMMGTNLNSLLQFMDSCDYAEFFCDNYDVRGRQSHHDGTHFLLYRQLKPTLSEQQLENFLDKLYYGTLKKGDISRYTLSLRPLVAKVYGW